MENRLKEEEVGQIIEILAESYPDPRTELNYESDLDLLIAVMMSAQTTDVQVNKVTDKLFKVARSAQDYLDLGQERLADMIKSIGFYNVKSKHIIETCQILIDDYDGQVPSTREELMDLPGVGRKTANVVVSNLFDTPAIAVDTHVFRVSNRLGLVDAKTVDETERQLMEVLPEESWTKMHNRLILHGRRVCRARNPICQECELSQLCLYYKDGGSQ